MFEMCNLIAKITIPCLVRLTLSDCDDDCCDYGDDGGDDGAHV